MVVPWIRHCQKAGAFYDWVIFSFYTGSRINGVRLVLYLSLLLAEVGAVWSFLWFEQFCFVTLR